MVDVNTQTKLTSWPSPQDYNEAVQNLQANMQDAQLQAGQVELTALGLPRPLTGAFASVYRVDTPSGPVAVRCFLRDMANQEARYLQISDFVQHDSLPYTVGFDYLRQGIRVGANWFPALKMDWVDGPNLDQYVKQNLTDPEKIAALANSFKQMCADLHEAGIAHGDLQHGNIIVCGDELRLVDYDGMYVPAMNGQQSNELGHRNFQHPARSAKDFSAQLDNFSAWVIYVSLRALAIDPTLCTTLAAGDDCLLFRRDDFVDPEYSFAFSVLEKHPNDEIRQLAKFFRWQCKRKLGDVPPLTDSLDVPEGALPPMGEPRPAARVAEAPVVAPHVRARPIEHPSAPRPHSRPVRPLAGIEPELTQPTPRWVVPHGSIFSRSAADCDLVKNGVAARTSSLVVRPDYSVGYSFVAANGQTYFEETQLSEMEAFLLSQGNVATVLYDASDPRHHDLYSLMSYRAVETDTTGVEAVLLKPKRTVGEGRSLPKEVILGAAILIPLSVFWWIGCCLMHQLTLAPAAFWMFALSFLTMIPGSIRQSALVESGVPARATVVGTSPAALVGVNLQYTFHGGGKMVAKSLQTANKNLAALKPGDTFTVLFDAANPENHLVYELAAFRAI